MTRRTGGTPRAALAALVVLGMAAIGLRIGAETGSVLAGALATVGFTVFAVVLVVWLRRRTGAKVAAMLASDGPPAVDGALDCTVLPAPWPSVAADSLGWGANGFPVMPVRVSIDGVLLRIEKRRTFGAGSHPFLAEVPLRGVRAVRADRARQALVGTSLSFELDGGSVSLDLLLGHDAAEQLAGRFQAVATIASRRPVATPSSGFRVTSPLAHRRMSLGRAFLMLAATMAVWVASIAGIEGGPVAATTGSVVFVAAVPLCQIRPRNVHLWLSRGLAVVALAFAVDAVATGELLRLAGIVLAGLAALAVVRLGRTDDRPTG
ncbi:MAG TPA: hypothetical protein VF244_03700 [Acidimicrobiales bacterium]